MPTAKVIVRHSSDCRDRRKGSDWRKCDCRKSLLVYDGTTRKNGRLANRVVSAETRSWTKAEQAAQDWLDQFDPEKQELKSLRAEKERKQTRIEDAVALYLADMIARLGDHGTVAMARSLLGHVDPDTKAVTKNGHLFDFLDRQVPRPTFLAELTSPLLTKWRSSWTFGSDLTARQRWSMVKGFFTFCESQGWLDDSPARKIKPLRAAKGNRTAVFTDDQYTKILSTIMAYQPENVPAATRDNWQRRLTTFLELLRWSGMDLIDAVQFTPDLVDNDGVLRYRRQKTGVLATVPLPDRLVVLLRDVPPERDTIGPEQPFRQRDCTVDSDTRTWARRLEAMFALAGIHEVRTDHRVRKPHVKMLRDTFAVWHLRNGAKLHTVSKMLGHAKTETTEKSYLPWVKELEQAHIEDARKALANLPKEPLGAKVVTLASRA